MRGTRGALSEYFCLIVLEGSGGFEMKKKIKLIFQTFVLSLCAFVAASRFNIKRKIKQGGLLVITVEILLCSFTETCKNQLCNFKVFKKHSEETH